MFVPRFWLYFETPGCFINTIFLLRCCENIKVGKIILILSQYCRKKVKKAWHLLPQHQSTYPRGPDSAPIEIPFQTQIHLVKVPLNVKIVKKIYFIKTVFEKCMKWGLKGWISIDAGLLGMYFDAVVVEVKTFLLLFRLALAIIKSHTLK